VCGAQCQGLDEACTANGDCCLGYCDVQTLTCAVLIE
jgi:hypothetical protein